MSTSSLADESMIRIELEWLQTGSREASILKLCGGMSQMLPNAQKNAMHVLTCAFNN